MVWWLLSLAATSPLNTDHSRVLEGSYVQDTPCRRSKLGKLGAHTCMCETVSEGGREGGPSHTWCEKL